MKKNYYSLLFVLLISFSAISSPLQGNYTIDSSTSTGGGNFKSWKDFQQSIVSNGVSGMVNIDVLTDEPSSPQIVFADIEGVSNSNRIIINGHGKMLKASIADAVILFNGADYITIDSLHINNSSLYPQAIGIRFRNSSDYNTISRCLIELSGLKNTVINSAAYIAFAEAANSLLAPINKSLGSYNTLQYNVMRCTLPNSTGPTFGIVLKGNSATYANTAQNNTVRGNIILNFYYMGIYMQNTNGNHLVLNDISRYGADLPNCYSNIYGIYSKDAGSSNRSNRIDSNHIHDLPKESTFGVGNIKTLTGIYTNYIIGTATYRFSIRNNIIQNLFSTENCFIMSNSYNHFIDILSNIVFNVDMPIMNSSGINFFGIFNSYIYGSYRINNNSIENCDGGYKWYGIQNNYPRLASGVQQINGNIMANNLHTSSNKSNIYSTQADLSDSMHPIEIIDNHIYGNSTDNAYTYNIFCEYYGHYKITDNIIEKNVSNDYLIYGMYLSNYGTYHVERNIIRGNIASSSVQSIVYGIYSNSNYEQHFLSNLIVENTGSGNTYGLYLSNILSNNYVNEIRQNTISINGSLSSNGLINSYPIYCNLPFSNSLNFTGNIIEVLNSSFFYLYLLTNNTLNADYNSYHIYNVNSESYATTSDGVAQSLVDWINLNLGNNELNAVNGHFFDSLTYASKWFFNQDNVPSVATNLLDVYSVSRDVNFSDRGAVEYSGITSIKQSKISDNLITIYPNPNTGDIIYINNLGIPQEAIIYDLTGKVIYTNQIESGVNTIDINLSSGVYIIYLKESGQTLKLIVE